VDEGGEIIGWRMGATWLTLFPTKEATHPGSNPRNVEFAIQVAAPDEVDALYQAFINAGAKKGWEPFDIRRCMKKCVSLMSMILLV